MADLIQITVENHYGGLLFEPMVTGKDILDLARWSECVLNFSEDNYNLRLRFKRLKGARDYSGERGDIARYWIS